MGRLADRRLLGAGLAAAPIGRHLRPMKSSTTIRRRTLFGLAAGAVLAAPLPGWAATPAAPTLSADDQALVDKAVAYLQGLNEAKGRFVQTDGRGPPVSGELFLKRPGKARARGWNLIWVSKSGRPPAIRK